MQELVINGDPCSAVTVTYPFTGASWGAFNPTYVTGVYVTLKAGSNTLEFRYATNRVELDHIEVVVPG